MRFENKLLVIATRNRGKAQEFVDMFGELGIHVKSLNEFDDLPDIVEDGATFAENARKKAAAIADLLRVPVLADDSGLCVDALNGAPGVYSARYAGEPCDDGKNNSKLLLELTNAAGASAPPSAAAGPRVAALSEAQYVCVLALHDPHTGETLYAEGAVRGVIISDYRGDGGFGYDPLFYLPQLGKTMAELSAADKNRISHRGLALRAMLDKLK